MIGKEERDAVLRVMERGVLSEYQGNWSDNFYGGPEIKALESEWAEYFGVKHAIACNSATSGLWMACAAIGLQSYESPRDFYESVWSIDYNDRMASEVIVTPYSMTCSASIPLHFGAKPVFADIEPDYFCLDPHSVESNITEHTRAIIVVDLFGQPYDADAINAIAEKYSKMYGRKIYVIEDAAQAIGAKYKGRYAGTLGDIGVYSLNRHKHIQCGEGGIVVTNDDDLAFKLRLAMNHSEAVINDWKSKANRSEHDAMLVVGAKGALQLVGMNLRMTELSAAIAREQLKKLEGIIKTITNHSKSFPVEIRPECRHAFYRYAFNLFENNKHLSEENKTAVLDGIKQGYEEHEEFKYNWKPHYITPIYKMPLFRSLGYSDHLCPVCEEVEENIVLAWLKEVP
ncbi:MAG: DegT/DnrJ/EryC1/StrS family aminotransferase [Eubacteriales bacterium]|nr:DegT/DnrJ/EryC1/StrS family aminotransferase [Eubacteriales bacterium]